MDLTEVGYEGVDWAYCLW